MDEETTAPWRYPDNDDENNPGCGGGVNVAGGGGSNFDPDSDWDPDDCDYDAADEGILPTTTAAVYHPSSFYSGRIEKEEGEGEGGTTAFAATDRRTDTRERAGEGGRDFTEECDGWGLDADHHILL